MPPTTPHPTPNLMLSSNVSYYSQELVSLGAITVALGLDNVTKLCPYSHFVRILLSRLAS